MSLQEEHQGSPSPNLTPRSCAGEDGRHSVSAPTMSGKPAMRRPRRRHLRSCLLVGASVLSVFAAPLVAVAAGGPASGPLGSSKSATTQCDRPDGNTCLLPFPDDRFTVAADTPTGRRVQLPTEAMPTNAAGTTFDTTEWNRNDGFSPGSVLLVDVLGLDLQATFGLEPGVEVLDRPALSLAPGAPIVVVDLDTGDRVPYYAELDAHPDAVASGRRLLMVRPLETLRSAHRYGVALRWLRDATGKVIEADVVFSWYRSRRGEPPSGVEPERTAEYERLFRELRSVRVAKHDLYLAWSFTVASDEGVTGRALHLRDAAFRVLGDADLADGVVDGVPPIFTVSRVEEVGSSPTARRVSGSVLVPNYLHTSTPPILAADGGVALAPLLAGSQARFRYAGDEPGPTALPVRNGAAPWLSVPYVCELPRTATASAPASPTLFGHGLLGSRNQASGTSTLLLRERNFSPCGVDFAGMSSMDQANLVGTLGDLSRFGVAVDRLQQGFLNFLFVGRSLSHPDGFASHSAFRDADGPLIDVDALSYTGVSQGAVLGGALVALAPDLTNGVLDVTGMNYSTLLNRSVDWEGAALGRLYYGSYTDPVERQLGYALLQMLWDRGESNGYARRTTSDPLPNTPPHRVLLHAALGDFQVANVAAEVQARSVGARLLHTSLAPGRHWSDDPAFGLTTFAAAPDGSVVPHAGSTLVYFDSGSNVPPSVNRPAGPVGGDPHGDPRGDVGANDQRAVFLRTGVVVDVHGGEPYWTRVCRGPLNPNCPLSAEPPA